MTTGANRKCPVRIVAEGHHVEELQKALVLMAWPALSGIPR